MRILRWFWGILTLLSCAFLMWSVVFASDVLNSGLEDIQNDDSVQYQEAAEAGAVIGTGLGLSLYLCIGFGIFIPSAFLYWRNGVGMERKKDKEETERRHQEQLSAMQSQIDSVKNKNS